MISRRRFLQQTSAAAALAAAPSFAAESTLPGSPKKGLGITTKSPDWARKLRDLRCPWFYSWGANIPAGVPAGTSFVPMVWGYWGNKQGIEKAAKAAKDAGIKNLLGFNEPDQKSQANLSVEKALDLWPILMETGLRLGSPGCVHPDRDWMKEFMDGVEKRKLRVDFICVHSYGGPNADALVKRLEQVHRMFDRPLWITEFAVGDWDAKSAETHRHRPDTVLRFMDEVLPRLDRLDFVERYAWFPAGQDNRALGTSALFDAQGKLTRLGQRYRDA
jgi:hypothetical protein